MINGGAGTDTLRIIASTGAQTIVPTLSSVENVEYQGFTVGTNTLNLTTSSSVEKVSLVNGEGSLNVTNAASIVDLAASNTTGGVLNVAYTAAAVAGTADVQDVSLNNTVVTSVVVNGVETFNIAAEGTNTTASVSGNAVTTVNVSGAGSLALTGVNGAFAATTTTFNASANTGGVSATFLAGGNVTATGGTGNDSFNFADGLTATDVVNGGAGIDTVRVTSEGDLQAATATAAFNALTAVERVAFDGAGVILNGSTFTNAAITNIELNTVGNDVINNAGSARTYEFGDLNTGSATFNLSGGSNVLNLALLGTVGTAAANDGTDADVGAVAVNLAAVAPAGTLATINISSLGDLADVAGVAANFNNVGVVTAVAGSTINITGAGNLALEGLTNRGIIDASKSTGNLVLEGSESTIYVAGNNGIDGAPGGGDDVAATAFVSGADVITLGTGQATIQFSSALDSGVQNNTTAATTALGLQVDTISGFKAGANGDVLDFTGNVGVKAGYTALTAPVQAQIDALSGATATLQTAADFAVANTAAATWAAFSFQGQTYAVYDAAVNGGTETYVQDTDLLVQLSGVSVAALTAANFA